MEKVSFPPLIAHLKEASLEYNQLYYEQELKSGVVDKAILSKWIVQVIEPIVESCFTVMPESLPRVFKTFYSNILNLLGSNLALIHESEYEQAWKICGMAPHLVAHYPQRILSAVNSALLSLRQYQPERIEEWLRFMHNIAGFCNTKEEFLDCGRILAWLCGMAHLRKEAIRAFNVLPDGIKKALAEQISDGRLDYLLTYCWDETESLNFIGCVGGFSGYGNGFIHPPRVTIIDGFIVAADTESSVVFFADANGSVLLRNANYAPELVFIKSDTSPLSKVRNGKMKFSVNFDDITSCVDLNSTLVLTRESSFYLYIYGYNDDATQYH